MDIQYSDHEDGPECRICRCPAESPLRPLFHPCRCRGSIRYTHEDCLVQWLSSRPSLGVAQQAVAPNQANPGQGSIIRTVVTCELCHTPFRFQPIYKQDTPEALPVRELLSGLYSRAHRALVTSLRILLVISIWMFLLPLLTSWTWQLMFVDSIQQAVEIFWWFDSPWYLMQQSFKAGNEEFLAELTAAVMAFFGKVISDALYGCALSAGIVFLFLGVSSLREYLRADQDEWADDVHVIRNIDPHAVPQVATGMPLAVDNPAVANAGQAILAQPVPSRGSSTRREDGISESGHTDRNTGASSTGFGHQVTIEESNSNQTDSIGATSSTERSTRDSTSIQNESFGPQEENRYHGELGHIPEVAPDMDTEPDTATAFTEAQNPNVGDDHNDQQEPQHEMQGAFLGLFDFDAEEVPLEEVIGLRGPIRNLFDNAGTVLISNVVFLVVFTFCPLLLGQGALKLASWSMKAPELFAISSHGNRTSQQRTLGNAITRSSGKSDSDSKGSVSGDLEQSTRTQYLSQHSCWDSQSSAYSGFTDHLYPGHCLISDALSDSSSDGIAAVLNRGGEYGYLNHIGRSERPSPYGDITDAFTILLGYGVFTLTCFMYVIASSLLRSRYPRLHSPLSRQLLQLVMYCGTFLKVLMLLIFEFGVFPLGCGWWLDVCTLRFVGSSWENRVAFCTEAPWTCHALHWFLGIVYMVNISLFVTLLREVLRPSLLWFLRNPDDPDFHPFRELVELPLSRHMRRLTISIFIYVPLILLLVYVPAELCMALGSSVFPFQLRFSDPLTEVPADLLLFHVCIPLASAVQHTQPKEIIRKSLFAWIRIVGELLGIKERVMKAELADDNGRWHFNNVGDAQGLPNTDVLAGDRTETTHVFSTPANQPNMGGMSTSSVNHVALRGACMIFLGWASLVVVDVVFVTLPTLLGRAMFSSVGLALSHDIYTFGIGLYTIWGLAELSAHIASFVRYYSMNQVVDVAWRWAIKAVKVFILTILWLGFVPLGLGLLLELTVIIPVRVDMDQSAYFYYYQDWALGLLLLKLWIRLVLNTEMHVGWRERMQRLRAGGFAHVDANFWDTLSGLVLPLVFLTCAALSLPYALANVVLPAFLFSSEASQLTMRFGYLCMTLILLEIQLWQYLRVVLRRVHDAIRDDKYLLGRRLHNFDEDDIGDLRADISDPNNVLLSD
eukprot:CAMPEP_0184696662 /NCGR_PEP_ID=MMETSP0313-20130426/3882_1 /TAXON_ID=2792 /ORGANISM="Porphyridium aerugineum, Strain SAG 1380-2" /LENGTH=1180 /DNA_ID=CAMNT_0027155331 /DNA_START=258 /DNA_END=3800 /DNA_ORIENTATION=-